MHVVGLILWFGLLVYFLAGLIWQEPVGCLIDKIQNLTSKWRKEK